MKRWLAYLLLFSIALVLLPKEWLHDCAHVGIHAHEEAADELTSDCEVCDFEFASFLVDVEADHSNGVACIGLLTGFDLVSYNHEATALFQGRAPPAIT